MCPLALRTQRCLSFNNLEDDRKSGGRCAPEAKRPGPSPYAKLRRPPERGSHLAPTADSAHHPPPHAIARVCGLSVWPVGLMDKASASGAGDSRFESWAGPTLPGVSSRSSGSQRLQAQVLKCNCPGRSWCKARARQGLQPRSQVAPAAHARAVECWHWRSARRPRVDSSGVAARL